MERIIEEFLLYLIDKQDCCLCKFEDTCNKLDKKGEGCLCDKAHHSIIKSK